MMIISGLLLDGHTRTYNLNSFSKLFFSSTFSYILFFQFYFVNNSRTERHYLSNLVLNIRLSAKIHCIISHALLSNISLKQLIFCTKIRFVIKIKYGNEPPICISVSLKTMERGPKIHTGWSIFLRTTD